MYLGCDLGAEIRPVLAGLGLGQAWMLLQTFRPDAAGMSRTDRTYSCGIRILHIMQQRY